MVIRYCPRCVGRPYTRDMNEQSCPDCGSTLSSEVVQEGDLFGRPQLTFGWGGYGDFDSEAEPSEYEFDSWSDGDSFAPPRPSFDFDTPPSPWDVPAPAGEPSRPVTPVSPDPMDTPRRGGSATVYVETPLPEEQYATAKNMGSTIRGRVSNYSNTDREGGKYRRFFINKLIDAIGYGQRTEDLLHRFTVRIEEGGAFGGSYTDIPVNVHGTISGGMQLSDNQVVEVTGTYRNGIMMARRIEVINNGYKNTVKFQRSPAPVIYGLLAAVILAFIISIGVSTGGAFFGNISTFLVVWLTMAIIVTILYLVLFARSGMMMKLFMMKHGKFPLLGIILVSLLLTLVCLNSFGLGTAVGVTLSGLLNALLPTVGTLLIILFGIWLMLSIFRR